MTQITKTGMPLVAGFTSVVFTSLVLASADTAAAQTITLVMDPPSVETNRFWNTAGDFSLNPSIQSLVGHDPETGAYDASGLASRWEHNADFTTWTFHLHEAAEFHFDWGPVTAADVVHSYALHTGEDVALSGMELLRGADLEVIDDKTIAFHLPEPRPNFLFTNAGRGSLQIYSKAQFDAEGLDGYDAMPAGSGPFRFVERQVGQGVTFERVDDHWSGEDASIETLDIRFAAEPATRLAMLLAGEADIAALPRELHQDAIGAGFEIVSSTQPAMQTAWLFPSMYLFPDDPDLNPDMPWLDVRIREAINRAIDREALIDVLYDGRAERLPQFMMHPTQEGWNQDLVERFDEMYGYDPERAKALLAEAGYPEAFADPVIPVMATILPGNPEFGAMAELMQVFMSEIGLEAEIRELDWAGYGERRRARAMDLTLPMRNAPIRPTEVGLTLFFSQRSPIAVWEEPETEALLDAYRASLDPEERDTLAQQAFARLFDLYTSVPLATVGADMLVDPGSVAGWTFPGVTSIGVSHFHLIEPAS